MFGREPTIAKVQKFFLLPTYTGLFKILRMGVKMSCAFTHFLRGFKAIRFYGRGIFISAELVSNCHRNSVQIKPFSYFRLHLGISESLFMHTSRTVIYLTVCQGILTKTHSMHTQKFLSPINGLI